MLKAYKSRSSGSESDCPACVSEAKKEEKVIPLGSSYITKRHGQMYLNRPKQPKAREVASVLLSQALSNKSRSKRSKSYERISEKTPLVINGIPFVPQLQPQLSVPLTQQVFSTGPGDFLIAPPLQYQQPLFAQPTLSPGQHYIPAFSVLDPNQDNTAPPAMSTPPLPSHPSQGALDQLKIVDAHFRKVSKDAKKPDSKVGESAEGKSTETPRHHFCAGCGRVRSRRYHQQNPIKKGEKPIDEYCGKCQDEQTIDGSSESDGERDKYKRRRNRKKKSYKKNDLSAEEDYVIIEEEESPEVRGRTQERGGNSRRKKDPKKYPGNYQPPSVSPAPTSPSPHRSTSRVRSVRSFEGEKPRQQQDSNRRRPHPHSTEDPIDYRYVNPFERPKNDREKMYPKDVPVGFGEQNFESDDSGYGEYFRPQSETERVQTEHERLWADEPGNDDSEFAAQDEARYYEYLDRQRNFSTFEDTYDDSIWTTYLRQPSGGQFKDGEPSSAAPWDEPHVLNPQPSDNVIVVTERYTYRKKGDDAEVDRHRQDAVRETEKPAPVETEESEHYDDDWLKKEMRERRRYESIRDHGFDYTIWEDIFTSSEPCKEEKKSRNKCKKKEEARGYRRDVYQDPELKNVPTSASTAQKKRASTPPSPTASIHSYTRTSRTPYPVESDFDTPPSRDVSYGPKSRNRTQHPSRVPKDDVDRRRTNRNEGKKVTFKNGRD